MKRCERVGAGTTGSIGPTPSAGGRGGAVGDQQHGGRDRRSDQRGERRWRSGRTHRHREYAARSSYTSRATSEGCVKPATTESAPISRAT